MPRRSPVIGALHDVLTLMASRDKEFNSFAVAVWQADSGSDVLYFLAILY